MLKRITDRIIARTLTSDGAPSLIWPHFGHLKHWRPNVTLGANLLKHLIEIVTQIDDLGEGNVLVPLLTQSIDHLGEPYFVGITRSHVRPLYALAYVSGECEEQ